MTTPYEYINLDEFDEPLNFDPFTAETNLDAEDNTESEIAVFIRDTKIKDIGHSLVPIEYLKHQKKELRI
ncbi:unnamed protein product [Rhizophagus irregularis]|nr:unnamed protein product [Rhizophagus irregularis]